MACTVPSVEPGDVIIRIRGVARQGLVWSRLSSAGLTPRDTQVARLLALGDTNQEIAAALGMSVSSVKKHLTRIGERLCAKGRANTAALAVLVAAGGAPASLSTEDLAHH